jgi:hypothetical protein
MGGIRNFGRYGVEAWALGRRGQGSGIPGDGGLRAGQ